MRVLTILSLCLSVAGASAGSLTLFTDPPGLEIWDGDIILGKAPIVVESFEGDEIKITVKGIDKNIPNGPRICLLVIVFILALYAKMLAYLLYFRSLLKCTTMLLVTPQSPPACRRL